MSTLGQFIKKYRDDNSISMRDLALKCDISHGYINKLEKGIDPRNGKPVIPTVETINKLSSGMNVPVEHLLALSGVSFNQPDIASFDKQGNPISTQQANMAYNECTQKYKISNSIQEDVELTEFWNKMKERESLQLLFKQTKDMNDRDINQVLRIIKAIEDEENKHYNN